MGALVERMRTASKFAGSEYLTVRDETPRSRFARRRRPNSGRSWSAQPAKAKKCCSSRCSSHSAALKRVLSSGLERVELHDEPARVSCRMSALRSGDPGCPSRTRGGQSGTNALLVVAHGSSTGAWNDQVVAWSTRWIGPAPRQSRS